MGTRADFYVGVGKQAEWLGSIGCDGYPDGVDEAVRRAKTEAGYRAAVAAFAKTREDWTAPDLGWPWPWDDSGTTDYAYAFDGFAVWASSFGGKWFAADKPEPGSDNESDEPIVITEAEIVAAINAPPSGKDMFPDMSSRKAVTLGPRSGLLVLGG